MAMVSFFMSFFSIILANSYRPWGYLKLESFILIGGSLNPMTKKTPVSFRSSVFIVKWQGSCEIHIQGPYWNWQNCKYIYLLKSAEDCTCEPLVSLLKLLLSTVILTGDDSWLLKPWLLNLHSYNVIAAWKNDQNNQLSCLKNHKK